MKYEDYTLSNTQRNDVVRNVVKIRSNKYIKENGVEPTDDIIRSFTIIGEEELERWRRMYYVVDYIYNNGGGGDDPDIPDGVVRFIDYDGTVLYTYSSKDFYKFNEMPANPTHDGLISQGWNWSLEEAKEYVSKYGSVIIGQMYVTDDNKTRLYFQVSTAGLVVTASCIQSEAHGVLIDWGDGSEPVTDSTIGRIEITHTYTGSGNYVVNFVRLNGELCLDYKPLLSDQPDINYVYKVELGGDTVLGDSAFNSYNNLRSITLPNSTVLRNEAMFGSCFDLVSLVIPNNITAIPGDACISCTGLTTVSLPSNLTSIGGSSFYNCLTLRNITFPDSLSNIGSYAFTSCDFYTIVLPGNLGRLGNTVFAGNHHLSKIYVFKTSPFIIGNTVFDDLDPNFIIYVPSESVDDYKTAINWSNYSSHIISM